MTPVISNKNTQGRVNFTKSILHNIANLNAISPRSLSLFLILCNHADDNGSLITNYTTLAKLAQTEVRKIDYCLRFLKERNIITIKKVNIDYKRDIFSYVHDKPNYYKTNKQEWNVIDRRYFTTLTIKGKYLKITLNKNIVSFNNGYYNTLLLYVKNNLYYDTRLLDNHIKEG